MSASATMYMGRGATAMHCLALVLMLASSPVLAEPLPAPAPEVQLDDAARLLSRYPAGQVPVETQVLGAIAAMGALGTREELPLLSNLVRHERKEIRVVAIDALEDVRSRLRERQREAYAAKLTASVSGSGEVGDASACVAYAERVIGEGPELAPRPEPGDPETLLQTGQPHKALAAAAANTGQRARLHEALAREELGDVRGAVVRYTELLADGSERAETELGSFGVDTERLLLGLLAMEKSPVETNEARVLDILVRKGDVLTVGVLSERALNGHASDRATATDALVRMLDGAQRDVPLDSHSVQNARNALVRVSVQGPVEIREIAAQGL